MGSDQKNIDGFSGRKELPDIDPEKIVIVGLDEDLTDDNWFAFCPRADEVLDDAFIEDVRANGVRTPVDVYRDGNRVVLLDGRRRVRAARIAGVSAVRVNIRRERDPAALFAVNVSAEATRKPLKPTQRAVIMQHFMNHGGTRESCARTFNVTVKVVTYTLALLDTERSVQDAVDAGEISMQRAGDLAELPRAEQKKALAEMIEKGVTKGASAAAATLAAKTGRPIEPKQKGDGARLRPRAFLEKWQVVLKDAEPELAAWVRFVLGGPVPRGIPEALKESLEKAGLREMKKTKKAKAEKVREAA